MTIKPDELRELATKIRSLANTTRPLKERVEAAGGLISSALDAGAFSTSDFGELAAHNCRSRLQQKAKDRTAVWAAVNWLLKSTLGCPPNPDATIADDGESDSSPDPDATIVDDGESDSLPDPGATFPEDCEMVATRILAFLEQVARRNAEMLDDVKLALADGAGREFVDEVLWKVTVPLPPPPKEVQARRILENTPLTPQEQLEHDRRARERDEQASHADKVLGGFAGDWVADRATVDDEVTIRVRVVEGRAELDEPDPSIESLNRCAWNRIQEQHGRPVTLRLDQGRPVVTFDDGVVIAGQSAERYGSRPAVSAVDLIDRLSRCTYMPKLTDDELVRLRAHVEATASVLRTSGDRGGWEHLKRILHANERMRASEDPPDARPSPVGPSRPLSETAGAGQEPRLADPIPLTWLRKQVPQTTVKGDASKLAHWLRRRNVRIWKVAGRNCVERGDLLREFKAGSRVHSLIQEYGRDGE